ncbi:MAG: CoA transferase [Aeromicrobium sp.]
MSWLAEPIDTERETQDWADSGALALTGPADGEPIASVPGAPASVVRAGLARVAAEAPHAVLPGLELLSERAAVTGLSRRAPWSAGGAFRALPAADGWVGLSLARESDRDLVPALVQAAVTDPWRAVAGWLRRVTVAEAEERIALLGLPGSGVPRTPRGPRRDPVVRHPGGRRTPTDRLLVVDLTSLWAGPLCARLLGATGARVVKVEHAGRLDGARRGPARFYDLLHSGHESVVLDFHSGTGGAALRSLLDAADVVLEASRPRALRQLGIDASAHARSGTIWASITAYGRDGEDGMRVGFGDDVAAGAGLVGWRGHEPCPAADALADPLAGVVAAAAVIDALSDDHGCLLDVSMHDVAAFAATLDRPSTWSTRPARATPPSVEPVPPAAPPGADTARVLAELGVTAE